MKHFLILLVSCLVFFPTWAQKRKKGEGEVRKTSSVLPLSALTALDTNYVVYGLPQTVFKVVLTVEQMQFTSGVYAQYAEKLLGIPDARLEDEVAYTIKNVGVESFAEMDSRQLYAMHNIEADLKKDFLALTRQGVLFSLEASSSEMEYAAVPFGASETVMPRHTNIGVESFTKKIAVDSLEESADRNGLPVVFAAKSQEERAQEAARFIFQLRKRLYELITGEIDAVFGSNMALKYAVEEIHKLEQQYLSLFIGVQQQTESEYVYYLVPSDNNSYTICYFSEHFGVLDSGGRPITVELLSEPGIVRPTSHTRSAVDCFKYRIPEVVVVKVLDRTKTLFTGRHMVYQRGPVVNVMCNWF